MKRWGKLEGGEVRWARRVNNVCWPGATGQAVDCRDEDRPSIESARGTRIRVEFTRGEHANRHLRHTISHIPCLCKYSAVSLQWPIPQMDTCPRHSS